MKPRLFPAAVLLALCGCSTPSAEPEAAVPDWPEHAAARPMGVQRTDFDATARALLADMCATPRFQEAHAAARDANGRTPAIIVGNIEDRTSSRIDGSLEPIRQTIGEELANSGLFAVRDDVDNAEIVSRILGGTEGGAEDGELVQMLLEQTPADFILLGDVRYVDGACRLRLALRSLPTGSLVWEGN